MAERRILGSVTAALLLAAAARGDEFPSARETAPLFPPLLPAEPYARERRRNHSTRKRSRNEMAKASRKRNRR